MTARRLSSRRLQNLKGARTRPHYQADKEEAIEADEKEDAAVGREIAGAEAAAVDMAAELVERIRTLARVVSDEMHLSRALDTAAPRPSVVAVAGTSVVPSVLLLPVLQMSVVAN